VRAGWIPGIHKIGFDSSIDTILLEHHVRNREGFAEGAILAAKWIIGKNGFYEFKEVLDSMLKEKGKIKNLRPSHEKNSKP
jgi:4-hydroxy-tetrahydrodipicolinate reductase